MSKTPRPKAYPLRFFNEDQRVTAQSYADENMRSLNTELCVLIEEAINARKAKHAQ